jgi:acyl-[acyl-carrier-protein]-phospholipid O-acyltransferase/long-chain-fatty-acid--[acyl-carrier-protein] ligase
VSAAPQPVQRITYIGGVRLENTVYQVQGIPWLLLAVLFLLGSHSAIFGPAKYGILPEMVRSRDLPRFNGVIQMTTFLSLIFGIWIGGVLVDAWHAQLWKAIMVCVLIAVAGTVASFWVRRTPIAQRDSKFRWSSIAIGPETMSLFRSDAALVRALAVYSIFWFVAALLPMIINWLGVYQFQLSYGNTSLLLAISSVGIAGGFIVGGWLSGNRIRFGLVRTGAWGLLICLVLMGLPARWSAVDAKQSSPAATYAKVAAGGVQTETLEASHWPHLVGYRGSQVMLVLMGFFAGLFALPVQVFLQSRPPDKLKGRVIGTMNLVNWIAIILAAAFYLVAEGVLARLGWPKFAIFALAGLALLPIALFYRPRSAEL